MVIDRLEKSKFDQGQIIIHQGDVGNYIYFLVSGECETEIKSEHGNVFKTTKYNQPGDYFGEIALLKNAPRAATIQATTDVVVLSIDKTTFLDLLIPIAF